MASAIDYEDLQSALRSKGSPIVIDVRRQAAYLAASDALHAWCKEGKDEIHTWNPDAYRAAARA